MISIVSAYHNRKDLFHLTLKTITQSQYKDIEYIVVDDGSSPEHRIESFTSEFSFLKVIRIEPENKWYKNPCVPFNRGIQASKGDIIVLQNPECLHVHDVLSFIANSVNDSNYISISAYGMDPTLTPVLEPYVNHGGLQGFLRAMPQRGYMGGPTLGWYNHSRFRPVHFHFCSAITRSNMVKLNGFDERYALGTGYDDDELIHRIRLMGLQMIIADHVSVIHQYHPIVYSTQELWDKNHYLIDNVTRKENKIHVNTERLWPGI